MTVHSTAAKICQNISHWTFACNGLQPAAGSDIKCSSDLVDGLRRQHVRGRTRELRRNIKAEWRLQFRNIAIKPHSVVSVLYHCRCSHLRIASTDNTHRHLQGSQERGMTGITANLSPSDSSILRASAAIISALSARTWR